MLLPCQPACRNRRSPNAALARLLGSLLLVSSFGPAPACTLDEVDLGTKRCPCADGYDCVRGKCVPEGVDAGGPTGSDSGPSPMDSGTRDGAAADATSGDADGDTADATSGDAATLDATTPPDGARVDAGPAMGCALHPDALFCDDFESGDLSAWRLDTTDGEIGNVDGFAHRGARSIRLATNASSGTAFANATLATGVSDELYMRAWIHVPSGSDAVMDAFYVFDDTGYGVGYYLLGERNAVATWYGNGSSPSVWREGESGMWPEDEWFCIRARIVVGVGDGRVELWVGEELALVEEGATVDFEPFREFLVGVDDEPEPSHEHYMDDIVLDTEPVPCTP